MILLLFTSILFPPCVAQEIKYYSYTYLTKPAKQIPFLFIYVWVILLLNVKISINTAGIKVCIN